MPSVTKTPGSNCGAQFCFTELLQEKAEIEVWLLDSCVFVRACVCTTHVIFIQVSKDPDYFKNMEIHVKISMDGAQYSRSSSFCLLSFSIFNREYTLSPASKFLTKNCENPYYMNEYNYVYRYAHSGSDAS